MKNHDKGKPWRDRITMQFALPEESATIRYQRDLLISAAIRKILALHASWPLTGDRWFEITRLAWVILPEEETKYRGAVRGEVDHARLQ
jgi:hypothetical protein